MRTAIMIFCGVLGFVSACTVLGLLITEAKIRPVIILFISFVINLALFSLAAGGVIG